MDIIHKARSVHPKVAIAAGLGLIVLSLGLFSVVYAGRVYPDVVLNGVQVGGMTKSEAQAALKKSSDSYASAQIPVEYNNTTLRVPVSVLAVQYDQHNVEQALAYGRTGSLPHRLKARMRSLVGRDTSLAIYHYDDDKLTPFVRQVDEDITRPVANAQLSFSDGGVSVTPSQPGHRLDLGLLTAAVDNRLATMSTQSVAAPVYVVKATVDEDTLGAAKHKADSYVAAPLIVKAGTEQRTVEQGSILSWVDVTTPAGRTDMAIDPLKHFYTIPGGPLVNLTLNQNKVGVYVAGLASAINRSPQNAQLDVQGGKVVIAAPSHTGVTLDQAASTAEIIKALGKTPGNRTVSLAATTVPAEVNEGNLDKLGLKELISRGQTFFPGSPSTRLTNVRVGASKYDGVLLKPGETFSFGKILGDVGPAQGYVPELVILDNHEEKQYGGGLCQVSSTAYRAALLAGLPIVERHNHSFAVSYYTAPYGVPGVDATIYYPAVDFKFKNDTGSYILIQVAMQGTTLTFDYYGTKTKTGEIRGPQFVSGSTDATQPSHTVFYRDIKDLSGNVIKTDTINTYYESSKNFPITTQFN